jgi:hypothetical protein
MPVRGHGRNFKELGHPSDGAASIYGRHRIAVIDFNFVWTHLLHSGAYVVLRKSGGGGKRRSVIAAGRARAQAATPSEAIRSHRPYRRPRGGPFCCLRLSTATGSGHATVAGRTSTSNRALPRSLPLWAL